MPHWHAVTLPLQRRALPRRGQVDLWLTDLEDLPLDAGPSGTSRKERVIRQRVQQRFLLRLLLGSYLGVPGKDVVVVRDEFDKPRLGGSLASTGLHFNLSHSGRWLAIALTCDGDIGVDIEARRLLSRASDLATRYFSGPDGEVVQRLDEPARSECFLRQWTAREALVKAVGCGLAGSIGRIVLDCDPTEILEVPSDWPQEWQLLAPDWPDQVLGHIALPRSEPMALDCFWLQTAARS